MMQNIRRNLPQRGFTLIELAIVLAVTGVLFLGLYRLLSGGNQQVKDTAVANQQVQIINAAKTFLGSTNGESYLAEKGANATFALTIPDSGHAPDGGANTNCKTQLNGLDVGGFLGSFCDALPAGFSTSTINAYGQSFGIQVKTGALASGASPGSAPATYSFMVMSLTTAGEDIISDADGGRISSEIGSDGGFIYANANACPASTACGSYGAWKASPITDFGFGSAPFGHVASRTYYSPEEGSTLPWLARQIIPNDTAISSTTSPKYNTMTTHLFLGGENLYFGPNNNTTPPFTPASGTMNLQGGTIHMQAGFLDNDSVSDLTSQAFMTLSSHCSFYANGAGLDAPVANCKPGIQLNGDENVTGTLNAYSLYAGTFYYQASDARLKKDIQPLQHGLDDVMRLKPVSFVFKSGGQKSLGVIAQDLETIYPELVSQKPDGMKAVNYEGLIAPLISAVQELKQQNDELRKQLQAQSGKQSVK